MTESHAEAFYETFLKDLPVEQRPQFRSLLISSIATAYEAKHNLDTAVNAWVINNDFLREIIDNNPEKAFTFAIGLIALPQKPENEKYEYFRRYLLGNGLTMLADDELHDLLTTYLNENEKGQTLADTIQKAQSVDVTDWDEEKAFSTPEAFNLFAALTIGVTLEASQTGSVARNLAENAKARLTDVSVGQVVSYFMPMEDSQPLSIKLQPYLG